MREFMPRDDFLDSVEEFSRQAQNLAAGWPATADQWREVDADRLALVDTYGVVLDELTTLRERIVHHLANDMRERAGDRLLPPHTHGLDEWMSLCRQAGDLAANGPRQ